MKTFGYTYRDKEGALKSGSLQAPDRIDALRQIRAMGCVPVSVTEGKVAVAGRRAPWNRAVWIGVTVVVLVAALSVWLNAAKKPAKRAAPVTAAVGTVPRTVRGSFGETALPASPPIAETPPVGTPPRGVPDEPALTNNSAIVTKSRPQPVAVSEPDVEQTAPPPTPRPFKTATEQMLSMAMSLPPGVMMPPLPIPPGIEDDFANSLTNKIVIFEDDDERTIEHKEKVAQAKLHLLELVKQGRSVSDVLNEYQETTNERVEVRNEAGMELANILKNGTPQEAKTYLDKINKAFTDLGIEPITMPHQSAR